VSAFIPLALGLVFAAVLLSVRSQAGRTRPRVYAVTAAAPRSPGAGLATVCRGRLGRRLSEQVRARVTVAAADDEASGVQVFDLSDKPLITILVSHVRWARGWVDGRMVVAHGEPRTDDGSDEIWFPYKGGWELEIVTHSGTVYRCAGPSGELIEPDLVRLGQRMAGSVLARAS